MKVPSRVTALMRVEPSSTPKYVLFIVTSPFMEVLEVRKKAEAGIDMLPPLLFV